MRQLHLRDVLREPTGSGLQQSESVATQGHSHVPTRVSDKIIGGIRAETVEEEAVKRNGW
jgi:hypothetical protein